MYQAKYAILCCLSLSFLIGMIETPKEDMLDKSKIKTLILNNELKVILISNPEYNISSASMNVKVGSLSDPENVQGLAHFLEHLLFLGTEKYPDVEDYKMYLSGNGGYSNAYTAEDHTNYHFEVIHDAFEGGLDRFSQFFSAPLFNPNYTKREVNAVNSEFQKNLENDYWRMRQIKRTIYNSNHPSNHFEIGSKETLEGVDRKVLLDFHHKYYSSNQMSLSLLSKFSISEMETWVRKYFSDIENTKALNITYPNIYLSEENSLRLIKVKPIKNKKELAIEFPLPIDLYKYYESKPMNIIGALLGHEGKGSLLSLLKEEGLATGLSAGGSPDTPNYGSAGIQVQLTDKGVKNYQKILEHLFKYIKMLKNEGYKDYLFNEQKTMAELDERYSDKGEGAGKAVNFANNLAFYPIDIASRVEYYYVQPDSKVYETVLSYFRPNNMLCVLTSNDQETPLEEIWYKSSYGYENITGDAFNILLDPKLDAKFHLPEPNKYIPKKTNIISLKDDSDNSPYLLEDKKGLKLYFGRDSIFKRPKASYNYKIYFPDIFTDLRSQTLLSLYIAAVNESMNEVSYPARLASMNYELSNDEEGIIVHINGYNDSIDNLMREIVTNMKNINIPESQFISLKNKMIRDWQNISVGSATGIAREGMRKILRKYYFESEEYANESKKLTLKDIRKFSKKLLKKGFIQALVYGNVSEEQAINQTNLLINQLNIKPEEWNKVIHQAELDFNYGDDFNYRIKSEVNNSCLWQLQYFGKNSIEEDAIARVVGNYIESPFYLEMRTNQQLGYIVWGGGASFQKSSYFYFIIQSGDFGPEYLYNQVEDFSSTFPDSLKELSNNDFNMIKNSVIEKIKQKPTSIAEQAYKYFMLAFDHDGDFKRDLKLIDAVEGLDKIRSIEVLKSALSNETIMKASILLYSKGLDMSSEFNNELININEWKNNQNYK